MLKKRRRICEETKKLSNKTNVNSKVKKCTKKQQWKIAAEQTKKSASRIAKIYKKKILKQYLTSKV